MARTIEMPRRLGLGKGIRGPEFAGCCNTGHSPVIVKNESLVKYTEGYQFIVGPQMDVQEPMGIRHMRVMLDLNPGEAKRWARSNNVTLGKAKAVVDGGRRTVRFFKTYASAKRYFRAECAKIDAANAAERTTCARLRARANKGDVGAALTLGLDH